MPTIEQMQDLHDNMDSYRIGLDEPFAYRCRMCGRCCLGREDILLTPRDLFRAAKHLGMAPDAFVNRYCECYLGEDSRMPIVRLLPVGEELACPLLSPDGRCTVHESKPVICALFPLGRVYSQDQETGKRTLSYVMVGHACGKDAQTTPRQLLEAFGIPLDDEFHLLWGETVVRLSELMRRMSQMPLADSSVGFDDLGKALLGLLYLSYDTGKDFLPQFQKASRVANDFAASISSELDFA